MCESDGVKVVPGIVLSRVGSANSDYLAFERVYYSRTAEVRGMEETSTCE